MRWFVLCLGVAAAYAQTIEVTPRSIPQGSTLRITSTEAASARLNGRTARLFPQKEGGSLALMPVPATEKPGDYKVELLDKNGSTVKTTSVTVLDAHFPAQNIVLSPTLSELKASPDESEITSAFRKEVMDTRYWKEPLQAPVAGCMT